MPDIPNGIDLPDGVRSAILPEQKTFDGKTFPLILVPSDQYQGHDIAFWENWVERNRSVICKLVLEFGAILFRDFNLDTPTDFDRFCKAFGYQPFRYLGGAAVRNPVVGNVMTTNESPPDAVIPFHHELAHSSDYPSALFFFCEVPPAEGGQTPLAPSHVVYSRMLEREPKLVNRLVADGGLRYVRVAPDGDDHSSAIGRGWQSTFLTQDKSEAEKRASETGYDYEWLADGSMKTTTKLMKAIRMDERTGKGIFFNSIYATYLGWQDSRNDRTKAVIFPNGDTLSPDVVETLKTVMEEAKVEINWQKGDVFSIDNRQVMHSRRPFKPPRSVLASLYYDGAPLMI